MAAVSSYAHILSPQHSSALNTDLLLPCSCVLGETAGALNTHIVLSQVGFLFSSQDLQSCGLADTVGPHQPQHLTGSRDRQPAQTQPHKCVFVPQSQHFHRVSHQHINTLRSQHTSNKLDYKKCSLSV